MLNIEIDPSNSLIVLSPDAPLSENDFEKATQFINDYLDDSTGLRGIVIHTRHFPGWEDIGGFLSHLKFVRRHHKEISRVALVSDSALLALVPHIAKHFVSAEVKHFAYDEIETAKTWVNPI